MQSFERAPAHRPHPVVGLGRDERTGVVGQATHAGERRVPAESFGAVRRRADSTGG
ncbi:MAG TPA: hypothetical protein VF391_00905 [Dermatophilaceae bacterium]